MSRTHAPATKPPGPRPVSKPHDADEREADRAAAVVAGGGSVADWSFSAVPATVQREDTGMGEKPKTEDEKKTEALKKAGEAALATPQGQTVKEKVLADPVVKTVKDTVTNPAVAVPGLIAGVSVLAATGKELPIQPPAIPLDKIGLKGWEGKVTWKGPVGAPTEVGLTVSYESPKQKKPKVSDSEKFAAETARLKADQDRFRAGMQFPPGSKEAEDKRQEQDMINAWVTRGPGLYVPIAPVPEKKAPEDEPAPVKKSSTGDSPAHADVDDALTTPGRPLEPATRATMEERFGYDFSSVRLHDDARAAAVAARIDAAAFAVDDHLVFGAGRAPEGRLLAHELAHVVQQGANPNGAVHRYTAYSPADQTGGASNGWQHPGGIAMRVADDGDMAVEDKGWNPGTNKRAWTTPGLIGLANTILRGQKSRANLRAKPGGQSVAGTAPEAGGRQATLTEIEPFNTEGGTFDLASDCGSAARQVMGSGGGDDRAVLAGTEIRPADDGTKGALIGGGIGLLGGAGVGALIGLAAGGPLGAAIGAGIGGFVGMVAGLLAGHQAGKRDAAVVPRRLSAQPYQGNDPNQPELWSEELYKKEFGASLTRQEAYARYAALSPAEKDAFDRRNGINRYASPKIGQAQTIVTEKDMPGFTPPGSDGWNFHYAATVLRSGDDHVTLESAAGWDAEDWIFYLYGPPRKGQSFHEEHLAMGSHGSKASTYVVEPGRLND
jgi:hypothetical protein